MVRVGILFLGLLLTLASMAHSLPFGGVFFRLLDGAATTTVPYGSTVSMKGVFANGTGLIKNQDLATTFDPVVSGTTYTTLPLTSSKTYTLTVSNPAGDSVTAHVDVTVTPLSVGVTPTSASVTLNTPKPFTATVTNCAASVAKTVTWTVDGVPNGNSTVGTITADGVYTAPVTMTAPPGHTIRAISTVDTSQSGSASVTLVAAPTTPTISAPANVTAATGGYAASVSTQSGSTYAWTITNGTINTGATTNAITFTAGASGTVDLSCIVTNLAGTPSTAGTFSSSIVAAPVATSLTASPLTPTYGATFTLTPVYSAGTGTLTYAGGSVTCPASGVASAAITADWVGARIYTLTVTNALGAVATRTVTVTPAAPFVIDAFTSNLPLVTYGGSATLSWTLSGPSPTALTLDGASRLGNLSALVTPHNRQTFTLTGTAGGNIATQTLKVGAQGVDLLAGSPGGPGTVDGTGQAARFDLPFGVAMDAAGSLYVADANNHTIRKISPSGVVSTLAGLAGASGSIDGTGTEARFNNPQGVAVDTTGNVYVADVSAHTIRKITPAGLVSTLAGQAGAWGSTDGTSGDPTTARFKQPAAVAVDAAGNIYVADSNNHTIRQITPAGVVSTLAGLAGTSGTTNGTGSLARFNVPYGVAVDKDGYVYVADRNNHTIRKITISAGVGAVSTLAGQAGASGFTDGTATAASFYMPSGVAVDADRNIYVVCANTIRKITSSDVVSTFAGWVGTSGSTDATGTAARFNAPSGVAVDASGYVYVADTTNNTIRKITPGGVVNTLAGLAVQQGAADGLGTAAQFYNARGVAVDKDGNAYVGDTSNHTIRKITPAGVVSTLAGLAGNPGSTDGTGSLARFSSPWGVAVDATGNVYVADKFNYTIRKITPAGVVTTLAGLAGLGGTTDATGTDARFWAPLGVAVDTAGNVYVADNNNHTIRKITPAGEVTTLAGLAGTWGSADGTGTSAKFKYPSAVAVDTGGYVYVADQSNYTIRMITPGGVVSTLAGLAGTSGSTDGTGASARFDSPTGVAVDAGGNVYVADVNNYSIRKVTSAGVVTTVVGRVGVVGFQPGPLPGVLGSPFGVALTPDGDLVIVMSNAVVQVTAP